MTTPYRGCEESGKIARVLLGRVYLFSHASLFGNTKIVLDKKFSASGEPLSFRLHPDFPKLNSPRTRFNLSNGTEAEQILEHVRTCESDYCAEARKRYEDFDGEEEIMQLMIERKFPREVLLTFQIERGFARNLNSLDKLKEREEFHVPYFPRGFGSSNDLLETYFRWFDGQYKDDWIWPKGQ